MFKGCICEILDKLSTRNQVFQGAAYYYDKREIGSEYKGITDERRHYLYIAEDSKEKRDAYEFDTELRRSIVEARKQFKLVARVEDVECIETAMCTLLAHLGDCGVQCQFVPKSGSTDSEYIYKSETGHELKKQMCLLLIRFELVTIFNNKLCCSKEVICISKSGC